VAGNMALPFAYIAGVNNTGYFFAAVRGIPDDS